MTDNNKRNEVDSAEVKVYVEPPHEGEEFPHKMVLPVNRDIMDMGELVSDRIEANGRVTLPDNLADGETRKLGTVYWDESGIPTRLVRGDDVVHFTENGGFDRIE